MQKSIVTEQMLVHSACRDVANHAKRHTVAPLSPHVAMLLCLHGFPPFLLARKETVSQPLDAAT